MQELTNSSGAGFLRRGGAAISAVLLAAALAAHAQNSGNPLVASNAPINFYGKVIQDDGTPLGHVPVQIKIFFYGPPAPGAKSAPVPSVKWIQTNTDDAGKFSVLNEQGEMLAVVNLANADYERSFREKRDFFYVGQKEIYHPDPAAPQIFELWKRRGAQALIHVRKRVIVPYTGIPDSIDLETGAVTTNSDHAGDLVVSIQRDPPKPSPDGTPYTWSYTIKAPQGGIRESITDKFLFEAPESGYGTLTHSFAKDSPDWQGIVDVWCFIKCRDGRDYGRIQFTIHNYGPNTRTLIAIDSLVNTNGSRNLEYDPKIAIKR